MKKLEQFFNGKLSLAQSFWIWLVLANLAFQLAIMLLGQLGLFLTYLLFISKIVYEVFAIIGVWRSATNYIKKKKKVYWGWLAKISAVGYALEILVFIYILLIPVTNLQSAEIRNFLCKKSEYSFNIDGAGTGKGYYELNMPNQGQKSQVYKAYVKKIKAKDYTDYALSWFTTNYDQSTGTIMHFMYYQKKGMMMYGAADLNQNDIKLLIKNSQIDKNRTGRYKLKQDIYGEKWSAKKTKTYATKCAE